MLIVLADDFSGATEIAGIGYRYGLKTEIQSEMNVDGTADFIVVDTGTRAMTEKDAVSKLSEISARLSEISNFRLFKKIDSIMRGHLVPELEALQQHLHFKRIFVLPANPVRGRKIIDGTYFVNNVPLNETVFAVDPDFPCTTANVTARIRSFASTMQHIHADPAHLPATGLITGDVRSTADLKNYVAATDEHDLCCGGAELFECFLGHLGHKPTVLPDDLPHRDFVLIISGSTVKNLYEKELFGRMQIPQFIVPASSPGSLALNTVEKKQFFIQVVDALESQKVVTVSIGHPIHPDKAVSEMFLNYFVELIRYLTTRMQMRDIHFCLTGGATASAVIARLVAGQLHIRAEVASGVVSLMTDENELFTVKPGSYPWPRPWLEKLLCTGK